SDLFERGRLTYYLGIGSVLYGVDADLKWMERDSRTEHRHEHLRRFAEVAHLFLDAGLILISTAIDLTAADMDLIRTVLPGRPVFLVWADGQPGTDAEADLSIPPDMDLPQAVARVRGLLQDEGVLFRA
ncbi:MAG: adenylyl-sulfate kinase, partial [Verrucomicrobia bacterium]